LVGRVSQQTYPKPSHLGFPFEAYNIVTLKRTRNVNILTFFNI